MTPSELAARLDAAIAARRRLQDRPVAETAAALAQAAARWRNDAALVAALAPVARLSAPSVAAALAIAADALDVDAMRALAARELEATPPMLLVAHVVASNVPALAVPAIALACLAGGAVAVKSGRGDALSAPAFARALAEVDPALAATVVTAAWPGGTSALDDELLARADVLVATGTDTTVAALAARAGRRFVGHGARASVAVVTRGAILDADALALDIALHDQRGCLSPHAVYVEGDPIAAAEALAAALARAAEQLPPGAASLEERGAVRRALDDAEWRRGTRVVGTGVLVDDDPTFRPSPGCRTVRVHPLASLDALAALLPRDRIECVGVAGDVTAILPALEQRGVSRVCPIGRMQRPPLSWPRGQRAPLRSLLGLPGGARMEVES